MRIQNKALRPAVAAVLALVMAAMTPAGLPAQEHVVPLDELQQQLDSAAAQRQADEQALSEVFGAESSRETLQAAGLDAEQISAAVTTLDDDALAGLAERARAFQAEVAAGALNNQQITYILIALGTAVLILVIVAAD